MPRLPISVIYMQMAYQIAKLSYAERRKVGCLIVKDEQIVSFGYNGTPHGFDNQCEDLHAVLPKGDEQILELKEHGYCCDKHGGTWSKLVTKKEVLHAESNAITKLAKSTLTSKDSILYTTTSPCFDCAKLIIQAGVKEVYYCEEYIDVSGINLLEKAGIKTHQVIVWNND
jgi:dCMP deaminase